MQSFFYSKGFFSLPHNFLSIYFLFRMAIKPHLTSLFSLIPQYASYIASKPTFFKFLQLRLGKVKYCPDPVARLAIAF